MKTQTGTFLLLAMLSTTTAFAEVKIQSAQYDDGDGTIFLKGKSDEADLYVVNPTTNTLIGTLTARRGQFKTDMSVDTVPCSVRVQTAAPVVAAATCHFCSNSAPAAPSEPGESDVSTVRHAGPSCQ